ncbi:MAG: PTS lactose/cellobiose transporter subunit IIA [Spirochaetaceae bacterium]|jgi:PTS system cellobiose-specific IIA component|nr:PTS lactose/cellobiose transporter subunit IIA [Spirochaetaceae bacterium]
MENEMTIDAMNSLALEIIMQAGDARLFITQAIHAAAEGNFPEIDKALDEAKKKLAAAHRLQTDIVQSEGEGKKVDHTLLFIHAQDTLMTIYSEMNMVKQLKAVFKRYDDKIAALELGNRD